MSRMLVAGLPRQRRLRDGLLEALPADPVEGEVRHFPDGESYVRVDTDCAGRDVVVAATLARPDPLLLPLVYLARGLRDRGARRVLLAAPYLAYLRQDTRFRPGEVVTSQVFAGLLSDAFDGLATIDPHLHRYAALSDVYDVPGRVAHAAPALARWIAGHVTRPLIVGPDSESEQWVSDVARRAGAPYAVLSKTRRGDRDVSIEVPGLERYRTHTPVLVDDIVSTARTMAVAVAGLRDAGCPAPVCVGVHAVFAGDAYETLRRAGPAAIVTGDTIEHPSNAIPLIGGLAEAVRDLLAGPPPVTEGAGGAA